MKTFVLILICFVLQVVLAGQQEIFHHTECSRDKYVKVGCFNNQENIFKDVVATTLEEHPNYIGQSADWNNFDKHLRSLACICYERAVKAGYKYFAIGNYEICYGGKDAASFTKVLQDSSQHSDQCLSGHWYTECINDDMKECSGEADSMFVYEMRMAIPTQPAPIDGGYTEWTNWSPCDRTCGVGFQERERTCTNPAPSNKGKDCSVLGKSTDIRECQLNDCGVKVTRGNLIRTIPKVEKSFSFSLDIKPMGVKSGWTNIFRATSKNGNCCNVGNRIPAMFLYDMSTRLRVCNAIDDNGNHYVDKEIPLGKFTNVVVKQALRHDGNYRYSIFFDSKQIYSVDNKKSRAFENVKVYGSDAYYTPSNAMIRNFKFQSPIPAEYHEVKRNNFLQTIPKIEKTYLLSLNIKPTGTVYDWSSIIRVTSDTKNCCDVGSRIPAIFLHSDSTKLQVTNGINNNGNMIVNHDIEMGKFTNVKVKQSLQVDGQYRYSVLLDDKEVHSVINKYPRTYENAKVFIGDNFTQASKAVVEDFQFQSPLPESYFRVTRNEFIMEIPVITKQYRFSLDIKPLGVVTGWSNILRVNSGTKNCCSVGNRIPALFFFSGTTKLHVCNSISNNGNYYVNKAIPMGKFTNVKIEQILQKDGKYRYTVSYNDKQWHSVINNKPREFKNAKVFVGDRFYRPANAMVQNIEFKNL